MISLAIEAAIALIELAAQVAPDIAAAINADGNMTPTQKQDLIDRVNRARTRVAAYVPKNV